MRHILTLACVAALMGCEQATSVPVQPVSVKAESFCETMRAVLPPNTTRQPGKPRWSVTDRRETITDARRIGAAVDRNCSGR